jgi:hypothetical protein
VKYRKISTALLGSLLLLAVTIAGCVAPTTTPPPQYYPGGGFGPGGMMGGGGMMSPGSGIYQPGGQRINLSQATSIANTFLQSRADLGFQISEIMEFQYNFYVDFIEKSTGIHAFEALIDPFTGDLYPEPGPSVMWNTKYGTMSGMMWGAADASRPMTVTESQAKNFAQTFLDGYLPGAKAQDAERFYGYYTLNFTKDGRIYGMVSVNGYTGQVWYHSWHGQYLG